MLEQNILRDRMVDLQVARRGIRDKRVLEAMRKVPREAFVDPGFEEFAYEDSPLPISAKQTISQPYIVAMMAEAAEVKPGHRVLEVGLGSGYASAVLAQIADEVFAIERHAVLADAARDRFRNLKYSNVHVRVGDGTLGWTEEAPFDAILVAAGGPDVPQALKEQLAIGGRLVIPVGDGGRGQSLIRLIRTSAEHYEQENLGSVRFVPLIGAGGWTEDGRRAASNHLPGHSEKLSLPELIARAAEPLPDFHDPAFGRLFDRYADRKVVLLGEASHGTSEFYKARAAITRHLITNHGFTIVAVEADWPDAAVVNRHIRHMQPLRSPEAPFQRFPTWMWRNTDFAAFVEWMRRHNAEASSQTGFYGLDLYNMSGSIAAVLDYLDKVDPDAAKVARERYGCLTPWQHEPATYGRAVLTAGYRKCEQPVIEQCRDLLRKRLEYAREDPDSFLDAAQNARLIASAERYYRIMYYGGAESWNLRDRHMFETLRNVLDARGSKARAVVWAHNSHIGDARATEMGIVRDELNIGQLCREHFGDEAALIGFGTHTGTVAAASDWDGEMEVMRVRPSHPDSYERLCHDASVGRFLLDLTADSAIRGRLRDPHLERFIGVIYRPETELRSHYADASLARQFDAYVWFDDTHAVTPLGPDHHPLGPAETYPFGL